MKWVKEYKYSYLIIFWAIALLLYLVQGILYYFPSTPKSIYLIISEIGPAFFLAGLLTISVERLNIISSQELYKKEISKLSLGFLNLFLNDNNKTLHIDDKGFSDILLDIAGNSHYRKNYKVTFDEITDDNYINFYVKYDICNLLDSDQERPFSLNFDNKVEEIILNSLRIQSSSCKTLYEAKTKSKIKKITQKRGHKTKISTFYRLPSKDSVTIEFNMNHKLKGSEEKGFHFDSMWITKNLIIKVKNKIERSYSIDFSDFHNLEQIEKTTDGGYSIYKFNGFMLPYQGFEAKLIKKR